MDKKAIFITGGGSGIGRAVAVLFGQRGWFVGLGDVNEQGMAETLALLPGGFAYSHRLDVTDRAQWDAALAAFSTAAGGRIDAVFNNAGVAFGGPIAGATTEEIDKLIDVNFRGVVYGAHAAYPYLAKTAPGSVLVNTASAAALYGSAGLAVYSATKFAVRGLTEALDSEWLDAGIKVRSIMPSFIDTPLLAAPAGRQSNVHMRDQVVKAKLEFTPVEQVAEAVWKAATGKARLHSVVGKTAKQLAFAARWTPGKIRERGRKLMQS